MQETKTLRVWAWRSIGMLAICVSGCSTMQQVGAGAALPLAFAGDSVLMPFQMLGHASQLLIDGGNAVDNYTNERWGYMEYVQHDNPMDLLYFIPGYAFSPFIPLSQFDYYSMTSSCMKTIKPRPSYRRERYYY